MSTAILLEHLNPEQHRAVTTQNPSVLVIAGAGSGKTRVITSRIAHLITTIGAHPSEIIALTFTNKAANEMKERISRLIPAYMQMPFVGTFHSYCLFLLRKYKRFTNMETFSIIDSDDQKALMKRLLEKFGAEKRITPTQLQYTLSCIKNQSNKQLYDHSMNNLVQQLNVEYEREKQKANVLDFDDLMVKILELFKNSVEFKKHFQLAVKHILIDEYQDTNTIQHALLKHMALDENGFQQAHSVCAVGDEDQSIYSWRGAQVENMRLFKEDFHSTEIIKIEQNYRSAEPILAAANHIISQNRSRTPKNLWSTKKASDRIMLATCATGYQEADLVTTALSNLPESITVGNVAILYRTHAQSRVLEEVLLRASIPYTIVGGIRFYERKEIKDLLSFLRLIANPLDRISLLRVINIPARGLGDKLQEVVLEEWDKNPNQRFTDLIKNMLSMREALGLSKSHERGLSEFLSIFEDVLSQTNICKLYEIIMERTDYLSYLAEEYEREEYRAKAENLRELYQAMAFFEKKYTETPQTELQESQLQSFLAEIALLQEKIADDAESANTLKLMTLHSAKGLEFDLVFITGLEETILPSSKSLEQREDIEEERRLFYVGITRAKEFLILSHALMRSTYGQRVTQEPSRFLHDLPEHLIVHSDISNMYQNEIARKINQFFGTTPAKNNSYSFGLDRDEVPHFVKRTERTTAPKGYTVRSENLGLKTKPAIQSGLTQSNKSKLSTPPLMTIEYDDESPWKINQKVYHATFGNGSIVSVNRKNNDGTYLLTISFGGIKKAILSSFLTEQ